MSCKSKISKAFKKGRKVGYWLAMRNIEKKEKSQPKEPKPKIIKHTNTIIKPYIIEHTNTIIKPYFINRYIQPKEIKKEKIKLELTDFKDISVKSKSKKKLELSTFKDVSIKSKSKKKLELSAFKDVSVKLLKPKPKKIIRKLEIEDQPSIIKKGISEDVKELLKLPVPSKKILTTEDLSPINIESQIIETHSIGIETEKRKQINLAIEEIVSEQTIEKPYIEIKEITEEDYEEDDYEEDDYNNENYSYDDLYDISGPGIEAIIIEPIE